MSQIQCRAIINMNCPTPTKGKSQHKAIKWLKSHLFWFQPKADWRAQHENFIKAIRYAKGASDEPPPPTENPDYVQCPHCERKFNPSTAERHIPKCKDIKAKPAPLKKKQWRLDSVIFSKTIFEFYQSMKNLHFVLTAFLSWVILLENNLVFSYSIQL